ncbi:MAG: hypothetical protein IPJ65_06235 [Archangiaceae bacterium]|nr:hypothetical protein [Archangiaceae bacterium]
MGTTCVPPPPDQLYSPICYQYCSTASDCSPAQRCAWIPELNHGICSNQRSPASQVCDRDSDCVSGLYCDTTVPHGFCTANCATRACPGSDICVSFSQGAPLCMGLCATPGKQSSCRPDQTCRPLTGKTYGYCL